MKLLFTDWKFVLKNRKATIAICILLLMPLLYAGMFIASYWNPYGKLDQLPVAVVNNDQPVKMDGKPIHVGEDLVENLKKSKDLDFHFVSEARADKGLKEGRYYITIKIPQNFSQKITTLTSQNPQPAQLQYVTNQGNSYIAGQIGKQAIAQLQDEVGDKITKSYAEAVFSSLADLEKGLGKASDGASKLNEGVDQTQSGFNGLQSGIDDLSQGTAKLSSGFSPLASGAHELVDKMSQLSEGTGSLAEGLKQFQSSQGQLEQGSNKVTDGVDGLKTGVDAEGTTLKALSSRTAQIEESLNQWIKDNADLEQVDSIKKILTQVQAIDQTVGKVSAIQQQNAEGITALQTGQEQLNSGIQQFGNHLSTAISSGQQLSQGADQLSSGIKKWESGFTAFEDGVQSVNHGAQQLKEGAGTFSNSLDQLAQGSGELATNLSDGADQMSNLHNGDKMVNMFSRPVTLVASTINSVKNYGTAMAPYFLTLGLFVGGLLAANVVPFNRVSDHGIPGWSYFVEKLGFYFSLSILQAVIIDVIMLFVAHLEVVSVARFLLLSLLASLIFTTLIFMLVSIFGPLGRFIAIVFLVLQLASSGGTFPLVLTPSFFQIVGRFLPMTYAVDGFRMVITTGDWDRYWQDIALIVLYVISFMIVSLIVLMVLNPRTPRVQNET
nr:YhgE/Pip domain-containing protein [Pullulanibacillus pueri]